jgi:hypothetical protein
MSSEPIGMSPEAGEAEAQEILARHPIELPKYRLDRVHVAALSVDYAPPHGEGYARPLSQGRLARLRREWDAMACSPLVISRRIDNTLWVIDGNHRRVVAYEMGMTTLPAQVFSGLSREREADLYTKLGTVLGQTPMTRFRARIVSGEDVANEVIRIVEECQFELDLTGGTYRDGTIQAVARTEWIYARGGEEGLRWVLNLVGDAYDGLRDSLGSRFLEGTFGFWLRYAKLVNRDILVDRLKGAGIQALEDRSGSIFRRFATSPGNSVGRAMAEMYNTAPNTKRLPEWQESVLGPEFRGLPRMGHQPEPMSAAWHQRGDAPAPQHLGLDA